MQVNCGGADRVLRFPDARRGTANAGAQAVVHNSRSRYAPARLFVGLAGKGLGTGHEGVRVDSQAGGDTPLALDRVLSAVAAVSSCARVLPPLPRLALRHGSLAVVVQGRCCAAQQTTRHSDH